MKWAWEQRNGIGLGAFKKDKKALNNNSTLRGQNADIGVTLGTGVSGTGVPSTGLPVLSSDALWPARSKGSDNGSFRTNGWSHREGQVATGASERLRDCRK